MATRSLIFPGPHAIEAVEEARAVKYLVTEDDGTTHLPYTDSAGKPSRKLMGAAWAALHKGYRGNKYKGPKKAEAIAKLKAVYKSEGVDTPDEKSFDGVDEERSVITRIAEEIRRGLFDHERQLTEDEQSLLTVCRQACAACYAGMEYCYWMPYDAFEDGVTSAMREAYDCVNLFGSIMSRESVNAPVAADLASAACRQIATAMGDDEDDEMLGAVSTICTRCADSCDAMPMQGRAALAAGEKRSAKPRDEVRSRPFELRASSDGHIKGYPVVFNELSLDLGGFRERILPGSVEFDPSLAADWNHDSSCILGRATAGTLTAKIDERGVFMDVNPPDTQWCRDLKVSLERKDVSQGSFAFRVLPGGQQITEENGVTVRNLSHILIRRLSVVSDPAYPATSVEVRSQQADLPLPTPTNFSAMRNRLALLALE